MLLVIAALLAATSPRAQEAAPAPQGQTIPTRSLEAVRVLPVGADDPDGASGANLDRAPVRAVDQVPSSGWFSLYGGRHFGLLVDGGVPAGAGVAGMFRPWSFLRVEGGLNWNYVSLGLRGGVTVIPFEWGITPTVHLEGGHFFSGDASRFSSDTGAKILLSNIPQDYLSASLGLEFGSQQRFVFFLRAGLCWIRGEARNIGEAIAAQNPGSTTGIKSAGAMPFLLQLPSVSAGALFFLF